MTLSRDVHASDHRRATSNGYHLALLLAFLFGISLDNATVIDVMQTD